MTEVEIEAYLEARSERVTDTGCRIWLGSLTGAGYGEIERGPLRRHYGMRSVHRIAFVRAYGQVPEGKEVDHKCNVRCCFNADHLQPLTHAENMRRAMPSILAAHAAKAKTHCENGHPFAGKNLRWRLNGCGTTRLYRRCRRCQADSRVRQRERLRAAGYIQLRPGGWVHRVTGEPIDARKK